MAGESVLTLISKVGSLFSIPIRFSDRLLERTQTSHIAGIAVAIGDGSTRTLGPNMDRITWSKINDPRDGSVITLD